MGEYWVVFSLRPPGGDLDPEQFRSLVLAQLCPSMGCVGCMFTADEVWLDAFLLPFVRSNLHRDTKYGN